MMLTSGGATSSGMSRRSTAEKIALNAVRPVGSTGLCWT